MRSTRLVILLTTLSLVAGCTAPKLASKLASVTNGHVSTLNGDLKKYADTATAARQADAQRLAAAESRWDQDSAYNQRLLVEWQIDHKAGLISAFDVLQKQSDAEMAITTSYVQRQTETAAQLEKVYGQVAYSPGQLEAVIAALQSLIDRAGTQQQLDAIKKFAETTLDDTKKELKDSQVKPAGGSQ